MITVARLVLFVWVAICSGSDTVDAAARVPENTCLLQHSAVLSSGESLLQPQLEESHQMLTVEKWLRRPHGSINEYAIGAASLIWMTDVAARRNRSVKHGHRDEREDDAIDSIVIVTNVNGSLRDARDVRRGNSSSRASETPFANIHVNVTANKEEGTVVITETIEIQLASPSVILYSHIVCFLPLLLFWLSYFWLGKQDPQWYSVLLSVTLCSLVVGQHLVNQTLVLTTSSPSAVTAIQSAFMMVIAGVWSAVFDQDIIKEEGLWQYSVWMWVATLFALYQLMNHEFALYCTLSERVVVNNLCPLVTIICESLFLPQAVKPYRTVSVKVSLVLMVLGATLYSCSSLDFTQEGLCVSLITVLLVVFYRVVQRAYLGNGNFLSLAFLTFLDGLMCMIISLVCARSTNEDLFEKLGFWLKTPSVVFMLILSSVTFTGQHLCGLAMLRIGSATSYLVFQGLAGFLEVALGIYLFGDRSLSNQLSCIGLGISLASGLWHSTEVVGHVKKKEIE